MPPWWGHCCVHACGVCVCVCAHVAFFTWAFLLKGRRETDGVGAEILYSSRTPSLQNSYNKVSPSPCKHLVVASCLRYI